MQYRPTRSRRRGCSWINCLARTCALVAILIMLERDGLAGDLMFRRHVINADADYSAAALVDVDRDGRLDIVAGGDWYQAPAWRRHPCADVPRIQGRPDGFSHLPFDVNRDGWTDIITVNYRSKSIKWMEHPGASLGRWTIHTAVEPGAMETGRLVDIDRDGKLDLLPNGARFAAWWEFRWNPENLSGAPAWIRHDLPPEAGGHGLGFGDIDGDGRGDIVGQFGWLAAPEDVRNDAWQWHPDYRIERGSIPMLVVDPDQDGDNDIVWCSAHGYGVYWLEQRQEAGKREWIRHAIDTEWSQGHAPLWADMDQDGIPELVTGKRYMAHGGRDPGEYDPIVIYRYQYNRETQTWDRWLVSPPEDRVGIGLDPKIADIDGDGDLDMLASGRSGLYWLENLGKPTDDSVGQAIVVREAVEESLLKVRSQDGSVQQIKEAEGWGARRREIISAIETSIGPLPSVSARISLDTLFETRETIGEHIHQRVSFRTTTGRRIEAELWSPNNDRRKQDGAGIVLASNQEIDAAVMQELLRPSVTLLVVKPDESAPANTQVWDLMRTVDLLQACADVHGEKLGVVGAGGTAEMCMTTAAIDSRVVASLVVVDMPAIDPTPTDSILSKFAAALAHAMRESIFAHMLACTAPRRIHLQVTTENAEVIEQVENAIELARDVFKLRGASDRLTMQRAPAGTSSTMQGLLSGLRHGGFAEWLEQNGAAGR